MGTIGLSNPMRRLEWGSERVREREMRRFTSVGRAQGFLGAHAAVSNLFNLGRHLVRAHHYRDPGISAFAECSRAVV